MENALINGKRFEVKKTILHMYNCEISRRNIQILRFYSQIILLIISPHMGSIKMREREKTKIVEVKRNCWNPKAQMNTPAHKSARSKESYTVQGQEKLMSPREFPRTTRLESKKILLTCDLDNAINWESLDP